MGAGLSGLSCAITLEKNGIAPTIFEKRNQVGDTFVHSELFLAILTRPIYDAIEYLTENYNIHLHPQSNIKKLILYSENEKAQVNGNLGYATLRGGHKDSLENQLSKQIKSKIIFGSTATYEELLKEFTHVIVATGDPAYTSEIDIFNEAFTVSLRGATVVGEFERYTAMAWLNNNFAPKGYGYFIPISKKEAQIVIGYPNYSENETIDKDKLWNSFYNQARKNLDQNLHITDQFQIRNYIIGACNTPRIGNTFFVGNCFGAIMPFLGFGQLSAILTGVYAAYDILGKDKYDNLTKDLSLSYKNSLALRRGMEKLNNRKQDMVVKSLNGYIGSKLFNSKYDVMRYAGFLLRPLTRI